MKSPHPDNRRSGRLLILLVLAALAAISLDAGMGARSPAQPARQVAAGIFGPTESSIAWLLSPVGAVTDYLSTNGALREKNDRLREKNAELRKQVNTAGIDRNRLAEFEKLSGLTSRAGFETVEARVVGYGSAQTFQRTVTINAGTEDGVREDLTVVSPDGLVGRVIRASESHSTVLLIVDSSSVVGARLGSTNELGTLRGNGSLSGAGRLSLTMTDPTEKPNKGDAVASWGSQDARPYVADVPIGRVVDVEASPREQSATVTVAPYVDFSSLDLVAVVVGQAEGG